MNDSRRFSRVLAALVALKGDGQNPDLNREVDYAIAMIVGRRPGIEEKYDALLLKLDRTYSQLEDTITATQAIADTSTLAMTRKAAKTRVKCMRKTLQNLNWIRARNSDLIKAAHGSISKDQEAELPAEVPEQADGGPR